MFVQVVFKRLHATFLWLHVVHAMESWLSGIPVMLVVLSDVTDVGQLRLVNLIIAKLISSTYAQIAMKI